MSRLSVPTKSPLATVTPLAEDVKDILRRHTKLGGNKTVSYLPLNTVENIIGVSIEEYASTIENNGASYLIFSENECCISSGAVYAFLPEQLSGVLQVNKELLAILGIPCEPAGFIRAIANTWFERESPITPLLSELFGD